MNIKITLSTIFIFLMFVLTSAQNINTIDVNKFDDSQIQRILQEMESRGLTLDQAIILAQSRGATPQQIEDLKLRIQEYQSGTVQSVLVNPDYADTQIQTVSNYNISEKAKVNATEKSKRTFGFNLFNNENLTFEPSINIPTPKNYVIGIGDELQITIWGASQQTYQLLVNLDGAIQIPDLGPIYISGMEFDNAKKLIIRRLTAIYSGMSGDKPNTLAEVNIASLRAIKINVIGEVNVPGTYNLPSTATVFNALYLSGGPNEKGSFRNIKLIRDGKTFQVIDVYNFLMNGDTKSNVQLRDQDIIFIPTYDKKVEILGSFKRNGFFELIENEVLTDLIHYAGNFSDNAYKYRLSVTKFTDKEMKIADVLSEEFSVYTPDNGDVIRAESVVDRFLNRVSISGAIYHPGNYELTNGLTLSQLIVKAEGVKEEVYSNRGIIIREDENRNTSLISFDVDQILKGENDIVLKKEDRVAIKDIFSMREERTITLTGHVQNTGVYNYHDHMTLKDLLFQAGGLKESASESFIEISRRHDYETSSLETTEMVDIFSINISRDLKLDPNDENFELKPFDHIFVRKAPGYHTQQNVEIRGEVLYPGVFSIESKSERISDLIKRAGGFTKFAYLEGASLERTYDTEVIKVEQKGTLSDPNEIDPSIRKIQANLVELNLNEIWKNPGSIYDYALREGDIITIPTAIDEIKVVGEIMNSIGLAYEKGKNLKYYIDKVGGFTLNAKKSKIYVLYSNGTTKTTKNSFLTKNYPSIEPGCQIIVPSKPEKPTVDNSGKWMAFASIMSSLAIGFATIFK